MNRADKAGLAPGQLLYTGTEPVQKDAGMLQKISYTEDTFVEQQIAVASCTPESQPTWYIKTGLADVENIAKIGQIFSLNNLSLEDVLSVDHRAKIEDLHGYQLYILRVFRYDHAEEHLQNQQMSIVVQDNNLLSFHETDTSLCEPILHRLRSRSGKIRTRGVPYLSYALIDTVVDHYFVSIEALRDSIERIEQEVLEQVNTDVLARIRKKRTQLLQIGQAAIALREALGRLHRNGEQPQAELLPFWEDLNDHLSQIVDLVDRTKERLAGIIDMQQSLIGTQLNEIMRVLTIISTVFIPLSFLAGLYGMNFRNMPELQTEYGYYILLGAMAVVAAGMLWIMRRKKWI